MKILLCTLLSILTLLTSAADIKIGLFYGKRIESVVFSIIDGKYDIRGNNQSIGIFDEMSIFQIDQSNSRLFIHDANNSYGPFEMISFISLAGSGVFSIRPLYPSLPPKESEDRLDIIPENEGILKIINSLDMEKYLPGSVEAEGGSNALTEYYKAQAVLARTFAVKNYYRHAHEGFNLCDNVHCQAFNGKSTMNSKIYSAVKSTESMILTDRNNEPVITAYHSSCGGRTASASVEWNRDLDYLVPVNDPFCYKSRNRVWTKAVPKTEWKNYLLKYGYNEKNSIYLKDDNRKKYLDSTWNDLPLTAIRRQFNLKSSWFYPVDTGNEVVFHGHGYGHGLGMCQEGAMEMARVGYTFVDILMFYFRGLNLTPRPLSESPPAPSSR